jgi:glucose-6-phosphate isomerase
MDAIRYDFSGASSDVIGESGIDDSLISKVSDRAASAFSKMSEAAKRGELGFLSLPDDIDVVERLESEATKLSSRFENLLVLGIGGSALGLKLIQEALLPPYYNLLPARGRRGYPRLFVCDNIDPDAFEPLLDILDWKQTAVSVISKSGTTTETISQFMRIKDILVKKYGKEKWVSYVYIITDPESGPLRRLATEEGIKSFSVPVNVGGRFSVLSPVGLFAAAATGVDIRSLLAGARDIRDASSSFSLESPILKNAIIHCLYDESKGVNISVMMPYSERLRSFGDWYAQLLAESLGKEGKGMTPLPSVGVTDQHSLLQLYMDGPQDKLITILGVDEFARNERLPSDVPEAFSYLKGHSLAEILKAEENATVLALRKAKRPCIRVSIKKIDEYHIGALIMAYEIQVSFMGMFYGINPFNQPAVELGKRITKEILLGKECA